MGFDSIPEVQINTDTGYNARLTPVLSFIREDLAGAIPTVTQILSVVDCVGKIDEKSTYICTERNQWER